MLRPEKPVSLATYRELRSHLQQLPGVQVTLHPMPPTAFDYGDSQVEGLDIQQGQTLTATEQEQLQTILETYGFSGNA